MNLEALYFSIKKELKNSFNKQETSLETSLTSLETSLTSLETSLTSLETSLETSLTSLETSLETSLLMQNSTKHLSWLLDLKTFGTDSYVWNNKNILHELYEDYPLSMNDKQIFDDALEYATKSNTEVGKAIGSIYGAPDTIPWHEFHTLGEVLSNQDATNYVLSKEELVSFLANTQSGIDALASSEEIMEFVENSSTLKTALRNSSLAKTLTTGVDIWWVSKIGTKLYLISIYSGTSNSSNTSVSHRHKIIGGNGTTFSYTLAQMYSTVYPGVFMNTLQNYCGYSAISSVTYKYIPITGS